MYSIKTGTKSSSFLKRILLLITAFVLVVSFIGSDMFAAKANAASKWKGWVKISSADDLRLMYGSSKKFYLTKDIDLKSIEDWTPIGYESYNFKGTLDGNGYAIKNLKSTKGGLFSRIEDTTIKNLGLLNVNIKASEKHIGAIAQSAESSIFTNIGTLIENCYITGKIQAKTASGLINFATQTKFKNCVNLADITAEDARGICGYTDGDYGDFYNCINLGNVKGDKACGITNTTSAKMVSMISCYNLGIVENGGDLMYWSLDPARANVKDCGYIGENAIASYITQESWEIFAFGSKQMTKEQLKEQKTYKGWDFKKTWYINEKINNGYPILQSMLKNYNQSKPVADKGTGKYTKGTKVSLSTELKDVSIYYTTDGKAPTISSKKYTGAITISVDTVIKIAVFTDGGKTRGKIATYTYTMK